MFCGSLLKTELFVCMALVLHVVTPEVIFVSYSVLQVERGSPADGHVQEGDAILSISNYDASQLTHMQARQMITQAGNVLQLTLQK